MGDTEATELRYLMVINALHEALAAERDFSDGELQAPGIARRLLADIDRLEDAEAERDRWQAKAELAAAFIRSAAAQAVMVPDDDVAGGDLCSCGHAASRHYDEPHPYDAGCRDCADCNGYAVGQRFEEMES